MTEAYSEEAIKAMADADLVTAFKEMAQRTGLEGVQSTPNPELMRKLTRLETELCNRLNKAQK